MRDEPNVVLNVPDCTLIIRYHKKCYSILTLGLWSWKSKSAKECVTTHLTNAIALKINGAESVHTYKQLLRKYLKFISQNVSFCDAFNLL